MCDTPTLFGEDPGAEIPTWFTAGNHTPNTHTARVLRGLHPFGLPLLNPKGEGVETCGNCANRVAHKGNTKTYQKCDLMEYTSGAGTDLRKRWAACQSYKPEAKL